MCVRLAQVNPNLATLWVRVFTLGNMSASMNFLKNLRELFWNQLLCYSLRLEFGIILYCVRREGLGERETRYDK